MHHTIVLFLAILAGLSLPASAQALRSASPHKHGSGYVFYAPRANTASFLIDNQANIVHQWPGSTETALAAHLLPNGNVLRTGTQFNPIFNSGAGGGGLLEEYSWNGDLVWRYVLSSDRLYQHHDVKRLPNGNVLILAWERKTPEEARAAGRDPARTPEDGVWSEAVFEVHPAHPEGGEIVWEWHVWDHLVQDHDPAKSNFGAVSASPHRMNLNFPATNRAATNPDWLHANSLDYNPEFDQILISFRAISEIWIIDHSTTTEEAASSSGGKRGKGGDILYRWGNPQAWSAGGPASQRFTNQHDATWIPPGFPGAGHILVLNNATGRPYSSADEIAPPVDSRGNYFRAPGSPFLPDAPLWTFGETAGPGFTTATGGGAQRLPNGNTLIALSNANRVVEVTPEKEIVWDLNLGTGDAGGYTFRALRLPASHETFRHTSLYVPAPAVEHAALAQPSPLAPGAIAVAEWRPEDGGMPPAAKASLTDSAGTTHPVPVLPAPSALELRIPVAARPGPARLICTGGSGPDAVVDLRINPTAPGLYSANRDGRGVGAIVALWQAPGGQSTALAFRLDPASNHYVPVPLPVGASFGQLYLSLYGTGFGADLSISGPFSATIAGTPVPVLSTASLPGFPGLDQINLGPIPPSLAGSADAPIVLTAGGVAANIVTVSFQ